MNDQINLIFDCDGTLIDSYAAITDTIVRLFAGHGIVCDPKEVRQICLLHHADYCICELALRHGLDPEATVTEHRGIPEDTSSVKLMPGVRELVADGRFRCFVFTHRGPSCRELLTRFGVADRFVEIVDRTYGLPRKPSGEGVTYLVEKYDLDRKKTYYVGDRSLDIECGLNAGVGTIFLQSAGVDIDFSMADYAVEELGEILKLELQI